MNFRAICDWHSVEGENYTVCNTHVLPEESQLLLRLQMVDERGVGGNKIRRRSKRAEERGDYFVMNISPVEFLTNVAHYASLIRSGNLERSH